MSYKFKAIGKKRRTWRQKEAAAEARAARERISRERAAAAAAPAVDHAAVAVAAAAARLRAAAFRFVGTLKTASALGAATQLMVRPEDKVLRYARNSSGHTRNKLLEAMSDPCVLAVFEVRTRNPQTRGVATVLVAYGASHVWSNKLLTAHMSMHQAIACVGHFTSPRGADGGAGRVPTKRMRDHAVAVLGEDYNVPYHRYATAESVGVYDAQSGSGSGSGSGSRSGSDSGSDSDSA
jgi:hypothetical protein